MAATSRKRRLSGEARRALKLLDLHDVAKELMLARGFTDLMLDRLVSAGLMTIRHELIEADGRTIEVGRLRITDAGRQELESLAARRPSPRMPEA